MSPPTSRIAVVARSAFLNQSPPISSAVEGKDTDKIALCFADDALVHDEGRDYRGRAAIKAWKKDTQTKSEYVMELLDASESGKTVKLRARLTGLPSQRRPLLQIGIPARRDGGSIVSQYRHAHLRADAGKFWGMVAVPGPSA
jgi:hypothetical protein